MSAIDDFGVGDVVKLAGSSTRMVVHDIDSTDEEAAIEGEIVCRWFNDADDLQEFRFKPAELINLGPAK
jgi:uncharacterized protein YodC (DUF2158 family)